MSFNWYIFILKVPKCEIFHRSDFPEFSTIKSIWVGDFGIKILIKYLNFWVGARHHLNSYAHAEQKHKFLMRKLFADISSCCDFGIDSQTLSTRLDLIHSRLDLIKTWLSLTNGLKSYPKRFMWPNFKKCFWNFATINELQNIINKKMYFNPQSRKVAHPMRLYGVKIMIIRAIENLTLGHLLTSARCITEYCTLCHRNQRDGSKNCYFVTC